MRIGLPAALRRLAAVRLAAGSFCLPASEVPPGNVVLQLGTVEVPGTKQELPQDTPIWVDDTCVSGR